MEKDTKKFIQRHLSASERRYVADDVVIPSSSDFEQDNISVGTDRDSVEPTLVRIGGWLILPAIGFVLGPILGVLSLIGLLSLYADADLPSGVAIYFVELLVGIGLLVFLIYAAIRFFGKKSNTVLSDRELIKLYRGLNPH